MNTSAEIILPWGDQERVLFALKGRQIEHLEKACGAHIAIIAQTLIAGQPSYVMIKSTIALGLEGGGMPSIEVAKNLDRFLEGKVLNNPSDPASPLRTAMGIIGAVWFGFEDIPKSNATPRDTTEDRFGIPNFRAKFVEFGVDPRAVDTMSLYEILSLARAMEKEKPGTMSDEDLQRLIDRHAELEAAGKIKPYTGGEPLDGQTRAADGEG